MLRETLRSMDTFHLTWETETDRQKCIYTVRIKAWVVDDWTRVRAVHLNHNDAGDLMSYVSFNINYLSYRDDRASDQGLHYLQKQFSHFL